MIYEHGQKIECEIHGTYVADAKICMEDGRIYICQDVTSGSECRDKMGYKFSWSIASGTPQALRDNGVIILNKTHEEVVAEKHDYDYWKRLAFKKLEEYRIPTNYFDTLEQERVDNKAFLHEILGMNEENNYRIIINTKMTEKQFRKEVPKTVTFIEKVIFDVYEEALKYSIVNNKVEINKSNHTKLSKVISKWNSNHFWNDDSRLIYNNSVKELGMNGSSIDSYISSLVDLCTPKEVVLSSNIYDMLTSSTGSAYSSCYNMNGEYFNGNLAYIRDNFTLISFTYSKNIERKVGRSWVYTFPEDYKILTPMRPYGSMYFLEYKLIRKYIQKCICKHFNVKNYWKFIRNIGIDSDDFENGRGAVYFDYDYTGMAYHKHKTDSEKPYFVFKPAICLECGDKTLYGQYGTCEDCVGGNYCIHCEEREHDGEYVNGEFVCSHCFSEYYVECQHCGNWNHFENCSETYHGDSICRGCLESNYTTCDDCDNIFHVDDVMYIEEYGNICNRCQENYYPCSECDELHSRDNMKNIDGELYCTDCYTTCKECGEVMVISGNCNQCVTVES